jgi:acyl-CoA thioester hydrolase
MANAPSPGPSWPFGQEIPVTFRDLDVLGHVNHAVYFTWMENLRMEYLLGLVPAGRSEELDFVLAEATARYDRPVRFRQRVRGEVAPGWVGNTSFSLVYRFLGPGPDEVLARGQTIQVMVDRQTYEKKPVPAYLREALARDRVDPGKEGWSDRRAQT